MGPAARRAAVGWVPRHLGFSQRRACAVVGLPRATARCRARGRAGDGHLRRRLLALAGERPRFGYRRLHALLRREGVVVNHKRVERLYREDGLAVRRRGRKRVARAGRGRPAPPTRPNRQRALDFLSGALASGRRIRVLAVIDACTRGSLAIEVDTGLPGERVARVLERVAAGRGLPEEPVLDNGPELTGRALDERAHRRGVRPRFIDPGKPVQNAPMESCNGRFRDERLNEHRFVGSADARRTVGARRVDDDHKRPHSALGHRTPEGVRRGHDGAATPLPHAVGRS